MTKIGLKNARAISKEDKDHEQRKEEARDKDTQTVREDGGVALTMRIKVRAHRATWRKLISLAEHTSSANSEQIWAINESGS